MASWVRGCPGHAVNDTAGAVAPAVLAADAFGTPPTGAGATAGRGVWPIPRPGVQATARGWESASELAGEGLGIEEGAAAEHARQVGG